MYKVEVLISAMFQEDMHLAEQCNANTDVLIINQCNEEAYHEMTLNGCTVRMISTKERGLSKSRNMALENAKGDICIFCDDDVVYRPNMKEEVIKAFEEKGKASIIAFNCNLLEQRVKKQKVINHFKKASFLRSFYSCSLAFLRNDIIKKKIFFNSDFGAGSSKISCGEESLWQNTAKRKGLKIYENPFFFADISQTESAWFSGYTEKFFYDKGAYLAEAHPRMANILKNYYIYRLRLDANMSVYQQLKWLNAGIKGYGKKKMSYIEYKEHLQYFTS